MRAPVGTVVGEGTTRARHTSGIARVLVTRRLPFGALERLAEAHVVETWPGRLPPSPEELRARAAEADGLLTLLTDGIDAALLDAAPRVRVVANLAVGSDNVDLDAARTRGVAVGVTPDVLTDATADLTWALLLAVARHLPDAAAAVRDGGWRTWEPAAFLGLELSGATLGVVGWGRIGRAVARRAEGFGMRLIHTRETPLAELLARADVVSLHVPLTGRTRGLIGAEALRAMKPTAILVNTARGAVVDQAALRVALADGEIAGAGLDVTDPEPLGPGDPLLDAPNLLVLPHVGSATRAARAQMAERAVDNLLAGLAGDPLPFPA